MKHHPKLNEVHDSFAMILCVAMKACGKITEAEREKFDEFFKESFDLSDEDINILFLQGKNEPLLDRTKHVEKLKEAFEGHEAMKVRFMDFLNSCIICDGIQSEEYEVFEKVQRELFKEDV